MPFDHASLTRHIFPESRQTYGPRDTILYALGLGVGADPVDPQQLRFVYEKHLTALPTMAVVLAHPGFWAGDPALGIDCARMLHVGQVLEIYRTIPTAATVIGRSRITDIVDRGRKKGAVLYYERDVVDAATGDCIATVRQTLLCRGNGSGDGDGGSAPEVTRPSRMPDREPDRVIDHRTLPQAALIYRLSGDLNPLHADPVIAAHAGFPRPILQGLALFGMSCCSVMETGTAADASLLRQIEARFTAPVFPGETIRTRVWHEGHTASFQSIVMERETLVLDSGHAVFADAAPPPG